jgi:hypothetical protein
VTPALGAILRRSVYRHTDLLHAADLAHLRAGQVVVSDGVNCTPLPGITCLGV